MAKIILDIVIGLGIYVAVLAIIEVDLIGIILLFWRLL